MIISWRIHIFHFMFSKLLDCDDLFVVFESESSSLPTIMIKMMNLITILHGKCIHNWFGHEKTKWLLRWYMHWNEIDKGMLILCLSSLISWSDIIVIPWNAINSSGEDIGIEKVIEHTKAFWCLLFIILAFILFIWRHVSQCY